MMTKKQERAKQHPDDFITVSLFLDFHAKLNPEVDNPIPLEWTGLEQSMSASEAVEYLEAVVGAIQGRRLYGFVVQEIAEGAVDSRDWIKKTTAEIMANANDDQNQ